MKRYRWPFIGGLLAMSCVTGCMYDPNPFSPTPEQDPVRAERASKEMEGVAQRNREAEARFFRRAAAIKRAPQGHAAVEAPKVGVAP